MTVQEIERIYYEGLEKIQAPPPPKLEPVVFGKEDYDNELTFVTARFCGYKYGNYERGKAVSVYFSVNSDEVLYYLFCRATYISASYNLKKCSILFRTRKIDQWRLVMKIRLDLLSIINSQYAQRRRKEYEEWIVKSPSRDGLPDTVDYLDGYPCPILNPNISPGSCPLDEQGGPCTYSTEFRIENIQ